MVSTTVLLTVILTAFAVVAGAFYALVAQLGARIDGLDRSLNARIDDTNARIDASGEALNERIDRLEATMTAGFDRVERAVLDHDLRIRRLEGGG